MVPFAGWYMPVQYAGITQEHLAVRSGCGIFDISHMGEFFVSGAQSGAWINRQLTNTTAKLAPGQGQYTLLLNESGGIIDVDISGLPLARMTCSRSRRINAMRLPSGVRASPSNSQGFTPPLMEAV